MRFRRIATAALCALALVTVVPPAGILPGARAAGHTTTIGPTDGYGLKQAMRVLRPGDTLLLRPGVYDLGGFKPPLALGTATAPITVAAQDPARPPELRGQVVLEDADHWHLSGVRVVATVPRQPALKMAGGRGWRVQGVEVTGAATTVVHANLVVDANRYTGTPPTDWSVTDSCIHGAARRPAGDTAGYHNIYVTTEGGGSDGVIGRNILFDAPDGANIKIGTGADARTPGASGISVENNSMYNANQQVLVFGNVSDIVVRRNLFVRSHGAGVSTAQYFHTIKDDGRVRVTSTDNYSALSERTTFALSTAATSVLDRGNVRGPDPRAVVACDQFRPSTTAAQAYGWLAGR
ncbi:hypothetical protein [uncultured Pseudokineococcus sp.]|uniref:hypothetical protein n=1 Tax=uncultured Pseudokineococcus sp. TaxID=1642928 RepID=UPI0026316852|nr:hypothetical protein [uncultured Pseudokineococcus sp.]